MENVDSSCQTVNSYGDTVLATGGASEEYIVHCTELLHIPQSSKQ